MTARRPRKPANTRAGPLRPATLIALAAAALMAGTRPGAADDGHWGAIAYGPKGVYGTASLYPSEALAVQAAKEACGDGCTDEITFLRACAAFAAGKAGSASVARDRYLVRARDRALLACRAKDSDCRIRVTVCTH